MSKIYQEIQKRILVLDGAMGTMLQQYKFTEEDFRGERFKNYSSPLQGNNYLLSITQPEAVKEVHRKYFLAGADIDLPEPLINAVQDCSTNQQVRQVGVEWCVQQSKELIDFGVPVLHYYSMGKSTNIEHIAKQIF
ncbi:MAG: homocysteine S-methyltransferase family protein [Flavobacteriaceae bacterium]